MAKRTLKSNFPIIGLYANEASLQTYHNATAEWCSAYKTEMANDGLSQLVLDVQQAPKTTESHTFTKPVHIDGSLTLPAGSAVSEVKDVSNCVESGIAVGVPVGFCTKMASTSLSRMLRYAIDTSIDRSSANLNPWQWTTSSMQTQGR